ncbi:MAG: hypothetical protein NW214_11970 [Pseudanabaenaceae cyanobacterium bins.39]|nr:hypothetical protein [Pseudanabaenaceae cyanobacterium bins.39]
MTRILLYCFLWISAMGLAIFSSQNINLVTIRLASFESIKVPIGLLLIFCAGLGAVATSILMNFISPISIPNSMPDSILRNINPFPSKRPAKSSSNEKNIKADSNSTKKRYKSDFDDDWDDDWN